MIVALQAGSASQTTQREIGAHAAQLAPLDRQVTDLRRQVLTLERVNRELEQSLSRLQKRVDGLAKPSDGRGTPSQAVDEDSPRSSTEWMRFRDDVLRVMEPEVQPLRVAVKRLETHRHEYGPRNSRLMKLADVVRCDACLVQAVGPSPDGYTSTLTDLPR